jgi:predicted alpha/beta superfamily hydrolase
MTKSLPTLLLLLLAATLIGQDIKIGFQDSIESKVLEETRRLFISLPNDYYNSDHSYPVIYQLDGDPDLFIETAGVIQRLTYREEILPEVIVVLIENTNRNKDMMPTNTGFFENEPGAENFKKFIEDELFLHMSNSYRVSGERTLIGQSLSSIFALYCYLTAPDMFDFYIASSAGFLDCEDYFINLTNEMLVRKRSKKQKVFLSHGAKDQLDPQGLIEKQLLNFTQLIGSDNLTEFKYIKYEEEGHVPFQSVYHGLKYFYE